MKAMLVLCILLTATLVGARSPADEPAADQSKLMALENAWNLAQLHHDAKALDALVPETFVYTDYDGTVMNKAQFLADIKDPAYRAILVTNQNVKVLLYQNAAIVIGAYHTKGTYKGKSFEHFGRFTDTWLYHDNKWQCVASHTNLVKK